MSGPRAAASRFRAVVGIAVAGLRHDRTRTALAVLGVTLAVLSVTLLGGTGYGVVETGQEKFDAAGRDIWITGGALRFAPGTVGGIENPILHAHPLAADLSGRESVATAVPLSFQTVYVGTGNSEYRTLVGVGGPGRGGTVQIAEGRAFDRSDVHYAGGSYDGPMTREVLVGRRTADAFDVSVGDTLHVGGTIASARRNEFRIVGITPTYSRFLGAPTVVMHLSELQEITGATGTDSASLVTVALVDGADPRAVDRRLERAYPEYQVRTNREQLRSTLERQAVVLASGASLVGLAIVAGVALTVNLMLGIVYQQRREFAALRASGLSAWTLVGVVTVQALLLGVIGGALGVGLTWPLGDGLDYVARALVGFDDIVRVSRPLLLGGFGMAIAMSVVAGATAAWRLARLDVLEQLES